MRLVDLAFLYLVVGLGCAAARLLARRGDGRPGAAAIDAALLAPFWPLYGPFLLMAQGGRESPPRPARPAGPATWGEAPTVRAALERAAGSPLAGLLPDAAAAATLERRLGLARTRVEEIDRLLADRDFDETAAAERKRELEAQGGHRAAAAAGARATSIRRLRDLRAQFARELAEIDELLVQLRVQAEVVRLAGDRDGEAGKDLVEELVLRLESLDAMLEEGA